MFGDCFTKDDLAAGVAADEQSFSRTSTDQTCYSANTKFTGRPSFQVNPTTLA